MSRLDLDTYRSTVEALGEFGDRRQGTQRNRDAVDWIEAQLQSYGCLNTERVTYMYPPEPRRAAVAPGPPERLPRSDATARRTDPFRWAFTRADLKRLLTKLAPAAEPVRPAA